MPDITLYEVEGTRSGRIRWALLEAGLSYTSVCKGFDYLGSDELKKLHPLGKVPVITIDGQTIFESAAIVTALGDLVPEKNLIAKVGTPARMLHDQWTCFTLTEMEAWLWSNALNSFLLPEEYRIAEIKPQNKQFFKNGAGAMDAALQEADYLVENRFTFTDIIAGFAVNWGRRSKCLEGFSNLDAYLERLWSREHCTLSQD